MNIFYMLASKIVSSEPPPDVIPMPPKNVPTAEAGLGGLVGNAIDIIFAIAGGIALLVIILLGYEMITTKGKTEEFKKAGLGLVNMAIGFVIIGIAYAVVKVIMSFTF